MKVAIFGDSFAKHSMFENKTLAWWEILSREFDITNYGEPGSCLFYSVELFIKRQSFYDKIIFLTTGAGRIMIPKHQVFVDRGKIILNLTSLTAEIYLKENSVPSKTEFFKAAMNYFLYIQNKQYDEYVHNLMKQDIKNIRPDGLFIDSLTEVGKVYEMENKHYGIDKNTAHFIYNDIRHCHMTEENNIVFANIIKDWLLGNTFEFSLDKFVIPSTPKESVLLPKT